MTEEILAQYVAAIRSAVIADPKHERPVGDVGNITLLHFFGYNVSNGGFAQLIFNAQGQYMQEFEDMLLTSGSLISHQYYVQAIRECLDDRENFDQFMNSDFVSPNALKDRLHLLTVEYFRAGGDLMKEASDYFLKIQPKVESWIASHA
ncbi:DUF4375 domain-containing protein [Undibacterium sp. LX40W]|uniref:DUF4375 domain-containing protein n=1 Tax=Undibacterium nitidum TaxID=2762298 RepID=A0A923HWS6_9BURK|nr:DUF4375 domain-containing protein [Undibacterium nitidum]MBC3881591.1 DUF4375 domain-containing protein [Undibacterium nitidum]MBC3891627.1 DUF4375 domain-containing protein [Undibacterium sp. LX40W]